MDAHRRGEQPDGAVPHCIDNTPGQRKLPFTLLPSRVVLHGDNTLDMPSELFAQHRQIILMKRSRDFLSNPKADRIITTVNVDHFIVFGLTTEVCVKSVVLGMIARRRAVVVVTDALGHWNTADADLAVRQMEAKGAVLATTQQVINNEVGEVHLPALGRSPRLPDASRARNRARAKGVA